MPKHIKSTQTSLPPHKSPQRKKKMGKYSETPQNPNSEVEEEVVDVWSKKKMKKKRSQVFLEGYVEAPPPPPTGFTNASTEDEEDHSRGVSRTVSLTDDDLDELKGCLDLGFGFNYEEIPELCNTLPALELCYSMSHRFLDDQQQQSGDTSSVVSSSATSLGSNPLLPPPPPIANWKISSPGDRPEEVKARLKFWAQAVACTVKLCN